MSQNFEILSRLEAELNLGSAVPKSTFRVESTSAQAEYAPSSPELLSLAQAVFFSGSQDTPHDVVLASIDQSGGSSAICLNLGRILAAAATRPVCLIDADFEQSRLTSLIESGKSAKIPFADDQCCFEVEPKLYLASKVVLDPVKSGALAPAQHLKKSVEDLRRTFEYILIDAPGANTGNTAAILGQIVDAAILVIEANATRKAAAARAKKTMESMNVRLLGTILNNRSYPIPEKLYHKL